MAGGVDPLFKAADGATFTLAITASGIGILLTCMKPTLQGWGIPSQWIQSTAMAAGSCGMISMTLFLLLSFLYVNRPSDKHQRTKTRRH